MSIRSISGGAVFLSSTALTAHIPDGTITFGNTRGANAVDWQTVRSAATQVASGINSAISGGSANTASGNTATVGGGFGNISSSTTSTVGGGNVNNATGTNSTVAGGSTNTASQTSATVAGGQNNAATGSAAAIGGGQSNSATQSSAVVAGGANNAATGIGSWVPGGNWATTRGIYGRGAWAATRITVVGDTQCGEHHLLRQTTDTASWRLTSDNAAPGTANQIILPNFAAYSGTLTVISKAAGSTAAATWRVQVSAVRGNGVGTVVVYEGAGTAIAPTASNGTGSAWRLDIAADTTNGGIAVTVTGAAATTINHSARFANVEATTSS